MSRQVQQLLSLAEVSEPGNYRFELTDPCRAAADAADYLQRLAESSRVLIDLRCAPSVEAIDADRAVLFVLLKNLIENAVQHSPAGAVVSVEVTSRRTLMVGNEGQIPTEYIPHLFERFWRGPERSENGAGLGLAICSEIADLHGWKIIAANNQTGVHFTLDFGSGRGC